MAPSLDRASVLDDPALAGLDLCRRLSALTDAWLADLFADAGSPEGFALVAVGGYGRAELSPQSDIDVMLLHEPKRDAAGVADRLWYPVWDAGLKLGHAVRTAKEALALADDDLDTATSLLSMRHLAGDRSLTEDLATRAGERWRKRAPRWRRELAANVDVRHHRHGEVAFLLEPDLKEGRGGLRDVHAVRWAELGGPVMLDGDDAALAAAYDVLLSVRVELHRRTGRQGDVLVLQEQDGVAEGLGYGDADDLMRAVSEAARSISWRSDDIWTRVEASLAGPRVSLTRSSRSRPDEPLGPAVVRRDGFAHLTDAADPVADPLLVLRTAVAAATAGVRIDRRSLERLAAGGDGPFPWDAEARGLLTELLRAGRGAIPVIESLDRVGLWVRLIPEWAAVQCRPQRNAYHTFTVDRHLIEAAVNAGELAGQVDRPDLLVVGTLLHDIGKGYDGDHTVVGIDLVGTIGARMGFPPEDVATFQEMVRYHLLLPDVATRRDLTDDGTIETVAGLVGSERTLRLLGALTEADSRATGPAAWSSWKAELVEQLVDRVAHVLAGGSVEEAIADPFPTAEQRSLMAARQQVIDCDGNRLLVVTRDRPGLFSRVAGVVSLAGLDVLDAAAYSDDEGMALEVLHVASRRSPTIDWDRVVRDLELALTGRLALSARIEERARAYQRPRAVAPAPVVPSVLIDNDISRDATVIEVKAADTIGALYRVTRAMAELELDIRSAKVQTLGTEVVDSFYVRDAAGSKITDRHLLAELERAVCHALEA